MTNEQLQNLGRYALYALIGAVLATGVLLGQKLTGADPVTWRPLAAVFVSTFFGTLATAVGSTFLPRFGSEHLAAQVQAYRALNYHRRDLTVVPKSGAQPDDGGTPRMDERGG